MFESYRWTKQSKTPKFVLYNITLLITWLFRKVTLFFSEAAKKIGAEVPMNKETKKEIKEDCIFKSEKFQIISL